MNRQKIQRDNGRYRDKGFQKDLLSINPTHFSYRTKENWVGELLRKTEKQFSES